MLMMELAGEIEEDFLLAAPFMRAVESPPYMGSLSPNVGILM
jgi:hypothetical protein